MPPVNVQAEKNGCLIDRRGALHLLAASMAAGLSSCSRPEEEIVPYVTMPERLVPGLALRFATSVPLSGYGRGVIAITQEGRPIKLEGNPRHPASLGGTDVFIEAGIQSLYDPDRSRSVRGDNSPVSSWSQFARALNAARLRAPQGAGLRILTGRITSPTFARQMKELLAQFPQARWHRHEPIDDDSEIVGNTMAFGRGLLARPRFADADIVWSVGADLLGPGPDQPRFARDFASRRSPRGRTPSLLRLYASESVCTLTGANADHRIALAPDALHNVVLVVAARSGLATPAPLLAPDAQRFAEALAADLNAHPGRALVVIGRDQGPELHALGAWLNHRLVAPVDYIASSDPISEGHVQSLAALRSDLEAGHVDALFIIGANPAYEGDRDFAPAIKQARFSAHLGLYDDETAAACQWHLPLSHNLESWSDIIAPDGTASIVQPLIRPLYDSRTYHALIAMIAGAGEQSPYALVRQTWQSQGGPDFEAWWRGVLEEGVIPNTAYVPIRDLTPNFPKVAVAPKAARFTLVVSPDPSIWDGSFSNNAWLQECPKPLTKDVWGNSIHLASLDARALGLSDGAGARLTTGSVSVEGPVRVRAGQAEGVIGVTLGYGRTAAGTIGNGVGFDVYPLRTAVRNNAVVTIMRASGTTPIYTTYGHADLDGEDEKLFPRLSLAALAALPASGLQPSAPPPTLLSYKKSDDGYAWAMVIDNTACIGCNACVVACQAENNVPVVGPEEIAAGREMHWLRIDAYEAGAGSGYRVGFQPVPCMQCEQAPCEPVCPVAASVHDTEGLNVQVYNRCIGTRFCQANCPYKVRRFNWFGYASDQPYKSLGAPIMAAQRNPDVTVRARGVMEKCTYCVQRISRARRIAEEENRQIRDGEMVTACQSACPTAAIHFGNLEDPKGDVRALRAEPHHYTLLGELGTRPRTTYLASISNPNPALKDKAS